MDVGTNNIVTVMWKESTQSQESLKAVPQNSVIGSWGSEKMHGILMSSGFLQWVPLTLSVFVSFCSTMLAVT